MVARDGVWRRVTAALTLLVVCVTTLSTSVHTAGDDDADHVVFTVAHDAAAHSITAPPESSAPPVHCLACHWARPFRPATEAHAAAAPVLVLTTSPGDEVRTVHSTSGKTRPPLRAPPSAPPALA